MLKLSETKRPNVFLHRFGIRFGVEVERVDEESVFAEESLVAEGHQLLAASRVSNPVSPRIEETEKKLIFK